MVCGYVWKRLIDMCVKDTSKLVFKRGRDRRYEMGWGKMVLGRAGYT